jgi:AcrR family transcriptional regulator
MTLPFDPPTKLMEATKALLDSARAIFVAEGVKGLSVRRVAQHAGCTTMSVYSRFGGKEGLLGALFDEGFERLAQAQAKVDTQLPPAERVLGLCRAYRATAQAYPHHYALMLGAFSGEHQPSPESSARAMSTLQTLTHSVLAALPPTANADRISKELAYRLFAFCHGWVSLERIGFFHDVEEHGQSFDRAVQALLVM